MKSVLYPHYNDYQGHWPWRHFTPKEIACKHCGEMYLDEHAMDCLERLRAAWGQPIVLNSAHRCVAHNSSEAVGGAKNSQHLKIAFDCRCPKNQQAAFADAAEQAGFTGIGRYPSRGFVHVDTRPKAPGERISTW